MASGFIVAFLAVKLRDPVVSKALYAIAAERGGAELVARINARMLVAMTNMLTTASDAHFDNPALIASISHTAVVGPVRALLEGHGNPDFETCLEEQLTLMLTAYLQVHQRVKRP
nr:hypothetical protein [Pseudomonas sp. ICMP 561]